MLKIISSMRMLNFNTAYVPHFQALNYFCTHTIVLILWTYTEREGKKWSVVHVLSFHAISGSHTKRLAILKLIQLYLTSCFLAGFPQVPSVISSSISNTDHDTFSFDASRCKRLWLALYCLESGCYIATSSTKPAKSIRSTATQKDSEVGTTTTNKDMVMDTITNYSDGYNNKL